MGPPPLRGRATVLFGASRPASRDSANGVLRSSARRASLGSGRRHSSEGRAPSLIGTRAVKLFGGSPAGSIETETPRLFGGTGSSSQTGLGSFGLTGVRQTALFGGSRAEPHGMRQLELFGAPSAVSHRDRVSRALRSPGAPSHPRQERLVSLGNWSLSPLGAREDRRPTGKGLYGCTPSHFGGGAVGKDTGFGRRSCRAGR
jgi:hypothetical protein